MLSFFTLSWGVTLGSLRALVILRNCAIILIHTMIYATYSKAYISIENSYWLVLVNPQHT